MSDSIFMVLCFLVDFIFSAFFPSDPSMVGFIVIPNCALCGTLLLCRKKDLPHAVVFAFVVGFLSDFFAYNASLSLSLITIICILIMKIWDKHLSNSLIEQSILLLSTIFIKEALVYFFWLARVGFQLSFSSWLVERCVPTLIANIVLVILVSWMMSVKNELDEKSEQNKRREESLFWKKFKL